MGLREHRGNRATSFFDQPHRTALHGHFHFLVIQSHLPQDGGVQVAVIVRILHRLVPDLVGRSVDRAALHASAGEPRGKAAGVVIAPGGILRPRRSAELAGPDHQCLVEHPALLQVAQQARDRPVRRPAERGVGVDVPVRVPPAVPAAAVTNLDEPNAALGEAPGQQELPPEVVGLLLADAVKRQDFVRLGRKIDQLRGGELHSRGQLVRLGPGRNVGIDRVLLSELTVQLEQRLHLSVALGSAPALRRVEVRDRRRARLERRRRHARAEVSARQLHRRRRPPDVHERGQVLVGRSERVRHPTPQRGVVDLPPAVPRAGLDDGGKVVDLGAPHRPHDGDVVDPAAHVREPVRDRGSRLTVPGERAPAGDDRPLHFRAVVAEPHRVDERTGPLVVLGIERVDVADAAAHEQKDHRLGLRERGPATTSRARPRPERRLPVR